MARSASDVRAGGAFVELFADDSQFKRNLRSAAGKLRSWGQQVTAMGTRLAGVGAAIAAPLLAATKQFVAMGDQLHKMSIRTGASVEALSELGHAAELSGSSLKELGDGLFRMRRRVANAAMGTGPAVRALEELGIAAGSLSQLDTDRQLEVLAEALGRVTNANTRAQLAFEIFGDSAKRLMPLLAGGAEGIRQLREQAAEAGATMSTQAAESAAALADAMTQLKASLTPIIVAIGEALAPVLTNFAEQAGDWVRRIGAWIAEHEALVVSLFKVAVAIAGVGAALIALSKILSLVSASMVLLTNPIGLVITAIALLIVGLYMLYKWWRGNSKAADDLANDFDKTKKKMLADIAEIREQAGRPVEFGGAGLGDVDAAGARGRRDTGPEIPQGVRPGETFTGPDGRQYKVVEQDRPGHYAAEAVGRRVGEAEEMQAAAGFSIRGVMSALGIRPMERTAKATEKTAENTGKMRQELEQGNRWAD